MILNLGEWPRRAVLSYSGTYTAKTITVNGKSYTLYSFTGSGTLSVSGGKLKNADIWACGGGGVSAGDASVAPDTTITIYTSSVLIKSMFSSPLQGIMADHS